ncbi:MAG: leucyl aminopeptidase [Thermoanaerobaculia bacterium]
MRIRVRSTPPKSGPIRSVAFLPETKNPAQGAPASVRAAVAKAVAAIDFRGRDKETGSAITARGGWTLIGLGKPPATLGRLRRAVRRAVRDALAHSGRRLVLAFATGVDDAVLASLLPQIAQADYVFDRYKSRETPRRTGSEAIVIPPPGSDAAALARRAEEAGIVAQAVAWARDLGNTPANDLGPAEFASEAARVARSAGLRLQVLEKRAIERERMAGLLAVNWGSARPPLFLIAEYAPPAARGTAVLVGKGITFDSGGISIKPAAAMGEMKYDMMGAATVLACVRVARALELPVRVVALAPLTENMPGGSACRPGDILRMRNGKTVEVENTDAEGRLVLADALSYAEKFAPDVLLDFATLTGAVVVALGHECAGLMTPDDGLARDLLAAGEVTGERVWRLPVWDDYRENLKSEWADMKNTAGRHGGTVNAGVFLKEFVPKGVPWAHVDVAGVAHFEKEHAGYDPGATGFGVALTTEFLRRRFGNS